AHRIAPSSPPTNSNPAGLRIWIPVSSPALGASKPTSTGLTFRSFLRCFFGFAPKTFGSTMWAIAISKWKLAMNTTHDDKLRDRLLEKTRPAHGVSCDEKTCEPNSTHDNRSAGISIPATQFDAQ